MKRYSLSLIAFFSCFYGVSGYCLNPDALIKVTKENNPKCVEFFILHNEMYCSTTATSTSVINPKITHYEKQKITFDVRPWQAAWGEKNERITTVEYVPAGDNIDQWRELVTSQFIPGIQNNVTLNEFMTSAIENLKKMGLSPIVHIIETTPESIIFEFQIHSPNNLQQDELQKITLGKDGMYVLHYAIKQADMDQANREKWVGILRSSSVP